MHCSEAVDLALKPPDIAILAPTMPGLDSLAMVRTMRTQLPETEVPEILHKRFRSNRARGPRGRCPGLYPDF